MSETFEDQLIDAAMTSVLLGVATRLNKGREKEQDKAVLATKYEPYLCKETCEDTQQTERFL